MTIRCIERISNASRQPFECTTHRDNMCLHLVKDVTAHQKKRIHFKQNTIEKKKMHLNDKKSYKIEHFECSLEWLHKSQFSPHFSYEKILFVGRSEKEPIKLMKIECYTM